jgi:hypothetical protein
MHAPLRTLPAAASVAGPLSEPTPPATLQLLQRWTPAPAPGQAARSAEPARPLPAWAHWLRRHLAPR